MSVSPIHPEDLERLGRGSVPDEPLHSDPREYNALIDPEDIIHPPQPTDGARKSAWKLGAKWLIGGSIGLIIALISLFLLSSMASIFGPRERAATPTEEVSELERLQADRDRAELEANRAKARLAIQQQSVPKLVPAATAAPAGTGEATTPEAAPAVPPAPIPVASTPVPIPRTPTRAPARSPVSQPPAPVRSPAAATAKTTVEIDPHQRWQQLAAAGVTSSVASSTEKPAAAPPTLPPAAEKTAPPPLAPDLSPGTQGILTGRVPPEPVAVVEPPPPAIILPGTAIRAVQTQPVIYNASTRSAYSLSLVALTEPLLDDAGQEVLPEGTQLVVEVASVAELSPKRALVKQWATQAIVTRAEGTRELIEIPPETVAVIGAPSDKGQLIAKSVSSAGGGFTKTLGLVLLGAIREVGRVANRPESQVVSNNINGSTISTVNGDTDTLAAVLTGASEPLLARAQANIARDLGRRDPIFLVPANTPVTVSLEKSWQPDA